jgi:hypothetical protein
MYDSIIYILSQRGITPAADSFTLQDDGEGAYIAQWSESSLGQQPSASEIAEAAAPAKAQRDRQAHNAPILAEIKTIEDERQPRAIRETALGLDGSVARLQALNDQIAALRGQLL